MGVLRKVILIAGGLAVMPSPPDGSGDATVADAVAYVQAAGGALKDAAGFCSRNPDACVAARKFASLVESKTIYSAQRMAEWAQREEPAVRINVDALETGSTGDADDAQASASTLKLDDLIPAWIGPAPRKG
jgi:Family of unknown function (DUF5330)